MSVKVLKGYPTLKLNRLILLVSVFTFICFSFYLIFIGLGASNVEAASITITVSGGKDQTYSATGTGVDHSTWEYKIFNNSNMCRPSVYGRTTTITAHSGDSYTSSTVSSNPAYGNGQYVCFRAKVFGSATWIYKPKQIVLIPSISITKTAGGYTATGNNHDSNTFVHVINPTAACSPSHFGIGNVANIKTGDSYTIRAVDHNDFVCFRVKSSPSGTYKYEYKSKIIDAAQLSITKAGNTYTGSVINTGRTWSYKYTIVNSPSQCTASIFPPASLGSINGWLSANQHTETYSKMVSGQQQYVAKRGDNGKHICYQARLGLGSTPITKSRLITFTSPHPSISTSGVCDLSDITGACKLAVSTTDINGPHGSQMQGDVNVFTVSGSGTFRYQCFTHHQKGTDLSETTKITISNGNSSTPHASSSAHVCLDHYESSVSDGNEITITATKTDSYYYNLYRIECINGCRLASKTVEKQVAEFKDVFSAGKPYIWKSSPSGDKNVQIVGHFSQGGTYGYSCIFKLQPISGTMSTSFLPAVIDGDKQTINVKAYQDSSPQGSFSSSITNGNNLKILTNQRDHSFNTPNISEYLQIDTTNGEYVKFTYSGINNTNYTSCGLITEVPNTNEAEVDVFVDFGSGTCYVYMSKLRYKSSGTNPTPDMYVNVGNNPSPTHPGRTQLGGGAAVIQNQISQTAANKQLFSLKGLTVGQIGNVANLHYNVTHEYPGPTLLKNSGGVVVHMPVSKKGTYASNIQAIINEFNNWPSSAGPAKMCEKPPPPTTGTGSCSASLTAPVINSQGNRFQINYASGGGGAGSSTISSPPVNFNTPKESGTTDFLWNKKGPALKYASEQSHAHSPHGRTITSSPGVTPVTYGGYKSKSHVTNFPYIAGVPTTATVSWDVQQVKVPKNSLEIANMLLATQHRGHFKDTEHFLIGGTASTIPVTIGVDYTEPDLTPGPNKPKHKGVTNRPRNYNKVEHPIAYNLTANYKLVHKGSGTQIGQGTDIRTYGGWHTHQDSQSVASSELREYEWMVEDWTLTINQKITAEYDSWQERPDTTPHASGNRDKGYWARQNITIVDRNWTIKGTHCLETRTMVIQMPKCKAYYDTTTTNERKQFNAAQSSSSGRISHPVHPVGVPSKRSYLELDNPNVFAIQTTSLGSSSTVNGPQHYTPTLKKIDVEGQPDYSVYPSPNNAGTNPNTKGDYQATANYVTPSSHYVGTAPTPASVINQLPLNTVTVNPKDTGKIKEQDTIIFEPGKFETIWNVRWVTAGRDANTGWRGDEFYSDKCKDSTNTTVDKVSTFVYIYAEAPTCEVNDYIIQEHLDKTLSTITVTLHNPNKVPMPLGLAQIRVKKNGVEAIFETQTQTPGGKMVIPERSGGVDGTLTLVLYKGPTRPYASIYETPYDPSYSSNYVNRPFKQEVDKVTSILGEWTYEPHIGAYIGNEDFTTQSSVLSPLQDSWFESGSQNANGEFVVGPSGKSSCSKSDENKIRIARRPYVKFYYGGIGVGGQFSNNKNHTCSTTPNHGYVLAHEDQDPGEFGGSSTQLSVQATDNIFGFYSASLRSRYNRPNVGLTLHNNFGSGDTYYGGDFGGTGICVPNYWTHISGGGSTVPDLSNSPTPAKCIVGTPPESPTPTTQADCENGADNNLLSTADNGVWQVSQPAQLTAPSSSTSTLNADAIDLSPLRNNIEENDGDCYSINGVIQRGLTKSSCVAPNAWRASYDGRMYKHKGNLDIENSSSGICSDPSHTDQATCKNAGETWSAAGDLGSLKLTVFVEGDIYIKSNILNNRNQIWHHPTQIGYIMFVVKGNIYIDPSVDTIDAILVAIPDNFNLKGEIWTCMEFDGSGLSTITDNKKHYDTCSEAKSKKLVVNGALVANKIHFNRIVNSVNEANGHPGDISSCNTDDCRPTPHVSSPPTATSNNQASEEINLVPEYFLASPSFPQDGNILGNPDSFNELPLNF